METGEKRIIEITTQDKNIRLDVYLARCFPRYSRSFIGKLIKNGQVKISGHLVLKSGYKIKPDEKISVNILPAQSLNIKPQKIPLKIIYQDKDIIVINKPAGMIVHPTGAIKTNTLVNALLYYSRDLSSIGGVIRPGIVHRLDKDTSGVLVVAKNDRAHKNLVEQFQNRVVKKSYLALVRGRMETRAGKIEAPIGRGTINRTQMKVTAKKGRDAITNYEVIKQYARSSLIRLIPETGRTHQLRVHLAYLGHPVIGDSRYGKVLPLDLKVKRQLLHSSKLGFYHPVTKKYMEFEADLPADFKKVLLSLD